MYRPSTKQLAQHLVHYLCHKAVKRINKNDNMHKCFKLIKFH